MRIEVTRSGGFAGITQRHVADPASPEVEALAREAEAAPPKSAKAMPDAFEVEVRIDGRSYVVRKATGAWKRLIEAIEQNAARSERRQ